MARAPRDRSHRKPPRPPFWDVGRGSCRFCGEPVLKADGAKNMRCHWHRNCISAWRFANDRFYARGVVAARDGGKCAICGTVTEDWEADHILPLALANGDLAYFLMSNVQTLCARPCHLNKSKLDREMIRAARAPGCNPS
jgi:5-methylcytosine-specific restriction endonuclease McrA